MADISGSFGHIRDHAAAAGLNKENYSITGIEQLYSPIYIQAGATGRQNMSSFENPVYDGASRGKYGGFFGFTGNHLGATRAELDPYFSTFLNGNPLSMLSFSDFQMFMNNGPDANNRKNPAGSINKVSVSHHRGPMVVSGWGTDLGDRPVPSVAGNPFQMNPEFASNRGTWKSGPVALQWDRDRKVWSMGHHMICGVAQQSIKAPTTPCSPTKFNIKVFRDVNNYSPPNLQWKNLQETCTITNRDPSLYQEYVKDMVWVVAARINYEWIPVWVGCPEQCKNNKCPDTPCANT